ncbi:HsdS variable domain [Bifidobacterium minimum]|uniref:HsdS variable domain n=1 Tax=Bifidobacterium minimum TaxID=1693 RepID=A0A087BSW1_9BIFI|nr:restriction endonuclease subunit S [Bifidobacterium minimum]KFI74111.1 HsdS variable domain [Bifidobacterium minimum]
MILGIQQTISIEKSGFGDVAGPHSSHAWEQRKLGDIANSYSGGTPAVGEKTYYGGAIPFIRSAEITGSGTELFLTERSLRNSSAKMVTVGDILYALYGATSGMVGIARIKGAINQAVLAMKPIVGYDSQFIVQWLRERKQSIRERVLLRSFLISCIYCKM